MHELASFVHPHYTNNIEFVILVLLIYINNNGNAKLNRITIGINRKSQFLMANNNWICT